MTQQRKVSARDATVEEKLRFAIFYGQWIERLNDLDYDDYVRVMKNQIESVILYNSKWTIHEPDEFTMQLINFPNIAFDTINEMRMVEV